MLTFSVQFAAIITRGLGFSTFESLLLQMSFGGAEIVFVITSSIIATYIPSARVLVMISNVLISCMGMALVWRLDADNAAGRMVGLTLSVVFAVNLPLSLSIVTSNIAGFSKRSVASGMIFVAYCVGNIVAPQFFYAWQAPVYKVVSLSLSLSVSARPVI